MTNGTNEAVNTFDDQWEEATEEVVEAFEEKDQKAEKKQKKQPKKPHTPNTSGYTFGSIVHFRDAESAAMFKKANINRFKEQNQKKHKKNDKPAETKAE